MLRTSREVVAVALVAVLIVLFRVTAAAVAAAMEVREFELLSVIAQGSIMSTATTAMATTTMKTIHPLKLRTGEDCGAARAHNVSWNPDMAESGKEPRD
ncbi:hypothetical protein MN608_11460 [Microdochium nivale]|nr:hypothetical protein MN608_11460 [Microdochium nivale]